MRTLKTKREFDRVYKKGKSFHTPYFVIFFIQSSEKKVGFVASKKVGKAVQRNRAKRLLRALFTPYATKLRNGEYVFVAKPKILEQDFSLLQKRIDNILRKFVQE